MVTRCDWSLSRRQLFSARAERDDMAGLAERRQAEVERAAGEIRALTGQVLHGAEWHIMHMY